MTVEQLLKPRYKVIADYPESQFQVGEILRGTRCIDGKWTDFYSHDNIGIHNPSDFSEVFRKLHWWEERALEEMPEYLKDESGEVWRVLEYGLTTPSHVMLYKNFPDPDTPYGSHSLYELTPATETEYNEYQKTLNP